MSVYDLFRFPRNTKDSKAIWGVPFRASRTHKARPVPGTAQASAEPENDEVPFSGACDHPARRFVAQAQKKCARSAHRVRLHCWSGEARARHGIRISCVGAGAGWAVLSSVRVCVCVQQGVPLKIRLFPKIRCSFLPCSGVKCHVPLDKVGNENIPYQIFSRTPL